MTTTACNDKSDIQAAGLDLDLVKDSATLAATYYTTEAVKKMLKCTVKIWCFFFGKTKKNSNNKFKSKVTGVQVNNFIDPCTWCRTMVINIKANYTTWRCPPRMAQNISGVSWKK